MLNSKTRTFFIISILSYLWLLRIQTTSADIFAERTITDSKFSVTTISFSTRSSVSNLKKQSLFNSNGLVPEGFDIGAVRMVKDGALDFKYYIKVIPENNNPFCEHLKLEVVKKDFTKIYDGSLNGMQITDTIPSGGRESWIFISEMTSAEDNLKQQTCNFKVRIRTYRNNPSEQPTGLYAEAELQNSILSGNW